MKASPSRILLDQDIGAPVINRRKIRAVLAILGLTEVSIDSRRSHSGGRHWVVEIRERLDPIQIVAIQACMGSDLKRETMNLGRVLRGRTDPEWNLLFDRKITLEKGKMT